ncbi:MAG: translation initiation factor IF-2 [Candidatus Cloacimonetes bacterium]|nr:translation initiation factor IF-2 [Candidatus Cloacimonadota bacterium]
MRVYEVAREFKIEPEKLIQLLRGLGASVRSEASTVDDATVAKLRARLERERRAGHDEEEVIEAVMEEATPTRRRRRRKADVEAARAEEEAARAAEDQAAAVEAAAPEGAAPAARESPFLEDREPEEIVVHPESASPAADAAEAIAAEAAEAAEARGEDVAAEAAADVEAEAAATAEEAVEEEREAEPAPAAEPERTAEPVARAEPKPAEERAPRVPTPEQRPRLRRAADVLGRTPPPAQRPSTPAPAASAGPGGQVRIQAEGFTADGRRKAKDKKKKKSRRVDEAAVQENISRVMAELKGGGRKRRHRREEAPSRVEAEAQRQRRAAEEAQTVRVNEFLTVSELAELIDVPATQIVASAFKNLGLMVTINQRLDFDQIELLLDEFGFRAVREEEYGGDMLDAVEEDSAEDLQPRPPVVTVMGHVDHGKTSLLDYIRRTNVVAGESGGITQHIGAYMVELSDGRSVAFLDTPGHAAFTAMRARGAEITDLVILVVAADDSVMPQTKEAISHAKNAGVPIVVAINKIDLPGADPNRIKQDLLQHGVVVEEYGGDVLAAEVSAKKGIGVDDLLEKVLLQAEMLDLKANPNRPAQGTVVEAQLDVGKGPVATVLVTNGTLRIGDSFVCGHYDGRVRALLDERGNAVEKAGPSTPVQVLGISGVPQAGDMLVAMEADRAAEIAATRQRLEREKQLRIKSRGVKLTDISKLLAQGETATLNLIIKGDVDGSVQALSDALGQLSTNEVQVEVIHRGVGAINESDVLLATTAGAIIIGFHVRPTSEARATASREGVDIRLYNIIYEAVEDVQNALEGMLTPEEKEVLLGVAEVRQLFKVPRVGTVAGCYVTEGTIDRRGRVRVVRDGIQVYEGELGSLKRFKDDVREVREGFECGLNITGFNDLKVGDQIECFRIESVARTLAGSATNES